MVCCCVMAPSCCESCAGGVSPRPLRRTPRRRPQHAAAACRSGAQQGIARQGAVWTCGSGWVTLKPQRFPRARVSGRPSWGKRGGWISCGGVRTMSSWRFPIRPSSGCVGCRVDTTATGLSLRMRHLSPGGQCAPGSAEYCSRPLASGSNRNGI